MKQRFTALALALSMTLPTTVSAVGQTSFSDVPSGHWAYDYVTAMSDRGVVSGMGDGKFQPDVSVSAAQFSTMLSKVFFPEKLNTLKAAADNSPWWNPYVDTANYYNILNGTKVRILKGVTSKWDEAELSAGLTRFDMAQIMYNTLKVLGIPMPTQEELNQTKSKIPDFAQIPDNYVDAVVTMYHLKCLSGTDSLGSFSGHTLMNRAQSCVVMSKLLDITDGNTQQSTDKETTQTPTETPQQGDSTHSPTEAPQQGDSTQSPTEAPQQGDSTHSPTEAPQQGDSTQSPTEAPQQGDSTQSPAETPQQGGSTQSPAETPQQVQSPYPVVPVSSDEELLELARKALDRYELGIAFSVPDGTSVNAFVVDQWFSSLEVPLTYEYLPSNIIVVHFNYSGDTAVLARFYGRDVALDPEWEEALAGLIEARKQITANLPDSSTQTLVHGIYKYIMEHTEYDHDTCDGLRSNPRAYNIIGVLADGLAVCEGYSDTFTVLCKSFGIDVVQMVGYLRASGGAHAWNAVNIDGTWYQVDATSDDPSGNANNCGYNYFLISDEQMAFTHNWTHYSGIPTCSKNFTGGLSSEMEDMFRDIEDAIENREPSIQFSVSDNPEIFRSWLNQVYFCGRFEDEVVLNIQQDWDAPSQFTIYFEYARADYNKAEEAYRDNPEILEDLLDQIHEAIDDGLDSLTLRVRPGFEADYGEAISDAYYNGEFGTMDEILVRTTYSPESSSGMIFVTMTVFEEEDDEPVVPEEEPEEEPEDEPVVPEEEPEEEPEDEPVIPEEEPEDEPVVPEDEPEEEAEEEEEDPGITVEMALDEVQDAVDSLDTSATVTLHVPVGQEDVYAAAITTAHWSENRFGNSSLIITTTRMAGQDGVIYVNILDRSQEEDSYDEDMLWDMLDAIQRTIDNHVNDLALFAPELKEPVYAEAIEEKISEGYFDFSVVSEIVVNAPKGSGEIYITIGYYEW